MGFFLQDELCGSIDKAFTKSSVKSCYVELHTETNLGAYVPKSLLDVTKYFPWL